jgi:hypothetical protein
MLSLGRRNKTKKKLALECILLRMPFVLVWGGGSRGLDGFKRGLCLETKKHAQQSNPPNENKESNRSRDHRLSVDSPG